MKKPVAILLSFVLLFNLIGFKICFYYIKTKAESILSTQIAKNDYDKSKLVTIRVPVPHLSDYSTYGKFEKTNGTIERKGILFKCIEKRFYKDSLELVCVPDIPAMKWRALSRAFFKKINDLQHGNKSEHHSVSFRFIFIDYYNADDLYTDSYYLDIPHTLPDAERLICRYLTTEEHPPMA